MINQIDDLRALKILEKYKKKIGKVISLDSFNERSYFKILKNSLIVFNADMVKKGNMKFVHPLYFVFTQSSNKNAYAFHESGIDFIAITDSLFLDVHNYFFSIIADSESFPQVGNPSLGGVIEKKFPPEVDYKKGKLLFFSGPKDGIRQDFAHYLSFVSLIFIALHELGHHLNGHILYGNNHNYYNRIHLNQMSSNGQSSGFNNLDYQTIEMDADAFAATNSLRLLLDIHKKSLTLYPSLREYFTDVDFVLKTWMFALHSTFLVLGKDGIKASNLIDVEYLPRRIRQLLNVSISEKVIDFHYPHFRLNSKGGEKNIEDMLYEIMSQADEKYCKLYGVGLDIKEIFDQLNHTTAAHTDTVRKNWNVVRPKLEPYARIELAPIVIQ